MELIYNERFDEISTFESFFQGYFLKEGNILMPYINIGISEHLLNPTKELLYLNYSYIICIDVILIKYNSQLIFDETLGSFGTYKIVYLGGTDLKVNANVEYQVICKDAFLQITDQTKLSKEFWVPPIHDNSNVNMNQIEVQDFFLLKDLPENLKKMFE